MIQKKKFWTLITSLSLAVFIVFSVTQVLAWTEPGVAPTGGNVTAPLRLDASGNLGIGTSTPNQKLQVVGGLATDTLESQSGADPLELNYYTGAPTHICGTAGCAASTSTFFKQTTGNVGIGTNTPSYKLDVNGSARLGSSTSGGLNVVNVDANSVNLRPSIANGDILISDDSAFATRGITIANGGNVGIGIATPAVKLQVDGYLASNNCVGGGGTTGTAGPGGNTWRMCDSGTPNSWIYLYNGNGSAYHDLALGQLWVSTDAYIGSAGGWASSVFCRSNGTNCPAGSGIGGSGTTNYISKFTGASTLGNSQIFDNATNVGIGTTSPSYKLHVAGEVIADGWLRTTGNRGWYNETYCGGWYMVDTSWIRSYCNKNVYIDATLRTDGELQVGSGGNRFYVNSSGNVGIGTAAPTSLFHVNSSNTDTRVYLTNSVTGSTGGNGLLLEMDTNDAYIWNYENGPLRLGTNSTERLTILGSGNVGIGITNPGAKLEVAGQVKITGGAPGAGKVLTSDAAGLASWTMPTSGMGGSGSTNVIPRFTNASTLGDSSLGSDGVSTTAWGNFFYGGGKGYLGYYNAPGYDQAEMGAQGASTSLSLVTNGVSRLNITPSGNVGIGTASPGYVLDVNGTFAARGTMYALNTPFYGYESATGKYMEFFTTGGKGQIQMTDGSSPLLLQQSGGNVGVGTTNPTQKLDVNGNIRTGGIEVTNVLITSGYKPLMTITAPSGVPASPGSWANLIITNNSAYSGGTHVKGIDVLMPGGAATGIASSITGPMTGGIGLWGSVTAARGTGVYGEVLFVGSDGSSYGVRGQTSSNNSYGVFGATSGTPTNSYGVYGQGGQGTTGFGVWCQTSRTDNGGCGGSKVWNGASDERLKKNIKTLSNGLDKVLKLRGVTFNWKEDIKSENRNVGFIAQEVMEVLPEVVNKGDDGYYMMAESSITAVLVEAVKELKAENDELRDRLEKLEDRVK